MPIAPDSILDVAKLLAARVATAPFRKRNPVSGPVDLYREYEELIPRELRQPERLADADNGYIVASLASSCIPEQTVMDCNLVHRSLTLLHNRCDDELDAAERAVAPFGQGIELITKAIARPRWQAQAPTDEDSLPELPKLRRMGNALLARATIHLVSNRHEEAKADFESALSLATRLRCCEGFLLHYIVGVALEVVVHKAIRQVLRRPADAWVALACLEGSIGPDEKLQLAQIMRGEFAGVCIPRALRTTGPWDPIPVGSPPQFELPMLAIQWILAEHPEPYDARETLNEMVAVAEAFTSWVEEGWTVAPAMEALGRNYAEGWPEQLAAAPLSRFEVSVRELGRARQELASMENPYGRLMCARTIHASAEVFRAGLLGDLRRKSTHVLAAAVKLGRRPACLEELVGNGLLERVPIDPFTDEPIAYEVKDHVIWSPGPGGMTYPEVCRCHASKFDSPYWLRL